ncbi:hypothetical protein CPB85DRAFT_1561212 [Mucidula mucida]|nr:hypothetical protein CPB85DRAFT_1561212 [Mucidula mucida]
MRKTAGITKHSSIKEKKMELRYTELAREMCGHYIGPMPVQSFLDDFLPWNKEIPQAFRDAKISTIRLNWLKCVAVTPEEKLYKQYNLAFAN